jgi:crotonobetainyl-CoA:carnitine CoA-transferase CaiB-like acyl-CoA transferase
LGFTFFTGIGDFPAQALVIKLLEIVTEVQVHSCRDVTEDYNLVQRSFWTYLMHPETGLALYNHSPMRMSKAPVLSTTPANMIGQHNQQVLRDLLKYTDEEIKEMEEKGVLN